MRIFGVLIEGYIILGLAGLFVFIIFVRGCSDYNAKDNKLKADIELKKIEAGYEQCPKSDSSKSTVIWVKNCQEYMAARKIMTE